MQKNKILVTDEYSNTHELSEKIGQGGQGAVYRTRDADTAIKIAVNDNTNKQLINKEKYDKKISYLTLLPLPEGIKITKPIALLQNKDKPGYVMNLLTSSEPMSSLKFNKKINLENLKWTQGYSDKEKEALQPLIHYIETGGLRRRLHLLSKASAIIAELHSLGMVFGDISEDKYPLPGISIQLIVQSGKIVDKRSVKLPQ